MVNVLLVEDDEADAFLSLEAVSAVGGVAAMLARTGDDAMNLLDEAKHGLRPQFDMMFVDMKLCGSRAQGLDLVERVRKDFPSTHIVVVTGTLDEQAAYLMENAGYVGFIRKPLMRENLGDILCKHHLRKQETIFPEI